MFNFAPFNDTTMTFDEIKRIPDLQIDVTPSVEDAFYFLNSVESALPEQQQDETIEQYEKRMQASTEHIKGAGERLQKLSEDDRHKAIQDAYKMIDNIRKYGIPCAQWA